MRYTDAFTGIASIHAVLHGAAPPSTASVLAYRAGIPRAVALPEDVKRLDHRAEVKLGPNLLLQAARGGAEIRETPCGEDDKCFALCDPDACALVGTVEQWDRLKVREHCTPRSTR